MTDSSSTNSLKTLGNKDNHFLIAGIGASAGGIQALRSFFENVPADSGIAYVVILHLSPSHDSQLAEVLSKTAKIPVEQVTERTRVEPDHVYVVPPNQHLEMSDGHIVVSPNLHVSERRAPVDIFFRTLAESHRAHAVAVILSGTGANGSMGIKRVKETGGIVFVQNPREAEYSDMPRNSIATGLVDEILNVADIPGKIISYKERIGTIDIPVVQTTMEENQQAALREIFSQLRLRTGHDFSNYKRATILRRIERRINVCGLESLSAYASFFVKTPEETQALLKDLLISVTNFFRDREAFDYLETGVIPRLIQGKKAEEPLRIWVAGCATGEEAYSLAMLLVESLDTVKDRPALQIFATDIDEAAITKARDGWYTLNDAADVSPDRLRRFFTPEADRYQVKKELRDSILFAVHNVMKDPPFSKLDLITCRNMLIYLNNTAQNRVMETFHFALKPGSYLFLGSSESVDGANDLFVPVNKQFQVFQSREAARRPIPLPDNSLPSTFRVILPDTDSKELKGRTESETRALERISMSDLHLRLLEQYAPPSIVINENNEIIHISERAGRFLQVAGGEPTQDILRLIRQELRLELRTALYQATQKAVNVEVKNLAVQMDGHSELINLHIRPVMRAEDTARGFILIVFEPSQKKEKKDVVEIFPAALVSVTHQLEDENNNLKKQLRYSNEQFEVQTEELKASNEELQAINEELRSAAEELETSKEELQSINEELSTVNQELKIKVEEVSQSNNDFQNLMNSSDIGTIFLDRHLRIKMFTPPVKQIFNLITADLGRPITDIKSKLEYEGLKEMVETALETLQTIERETTVTGGNTYLMQVSPYRTSDDYINGVVIAFVNITGRKKAEESLRGSLDRTNEILESISDAFYAVDANFNFTYVNKKTEELWGKKRESLIGKNFWMEFPQMVGSPAYDKHLKAMTEKKPLQYELESPILNKWIDVNLYPNSGGGMSCYFRDADERKRMEDALRTSERRHAVLLQLNDTFRPIDNPAVLQKEAARILGEYLHADRVGYAEAIDDIYISVKQNYTHDVPSIEGVYKYEDYGPELLKDLKGGKTVVRNDISNEEQTSGEEKAAHALLQLDATVNVPLLKDGQLVGVFFAHCARAHHWSDNEITLIEDVAVRVRDAVERIRAEAALSSSEERYRAIYNQATASVSEMDTEGNYTSVNQSFCQTVGYTEAELLQLNASDITYPDDYPHCKELMQQVSKPGGGFCTTEKRFIHKDGSLIWVTESITGIGTGENINSVVGVGIDISHRKQAEEALHESEERYRIALEAGELATWDWNLITNKVNWNQQHYRLFGVEHKEAAIEPEYFLEFIYPEDVAYVKRELMEVLGEKGIYSAEFRIRRRDNGKLRWMNGYGRVTERSEDNKPTRVSGVMLDSTDRREAEDNLKSTQNSLNTALEAAKMGVWAMDMTYGFVDRSAKHDQLLGFTGWQDEWSTDKAKSNIIAEDQPKFDAAYQNLLEEGIFELEARVKQTDGNVCWIYYYGRAFEGENGKDAQAAGVIFDISDRKTIEKQKDEFLGIASHELKTPVTSIKAYAEILQEMFTENNDFASADLMGKLDSQVDRLTKLIRDLLDVTKVSEGQLHLTTQSFSIENMTRNIVEEMQRTTRQHRIKVNLPSLPDIVGDEERLGQVLINLLSNAIKYSPESKDVLVNAVYENNKIVISVQDFGIGMSAGTLEKLFARFFRSDNPSVRSYPGLGLGLFISMEIMKRHGGTISVQSEREKGSVFTMMLPFV